MTRSLVKRRKSLEVSRQHLYTGKSGQLAVMAEFVSRGYNVAVPEVDIGDDIFVVRDKDGDLSRVQVKTATAKELQNGGYSATFKVSLRQLEAPHTPEMNYVLVVRHQERWTEFLVIGREDLYELHAMHNLGSEQEDSVVFSISFAADDVLCKKQSLKSYRNQWSRWPIIRHDVKHAPCLSEEPGAMNLSTVLPERAGGDGQGPPPGGA